MNKIMHPIEPEELMAHMDGELSEEREAVALAHLSQCPECQDVVSQMGSLSQALKSWEIRPSEEVMPQAIVDALDKSTPSPRRVTARGGGWRDGLHLRWRTIAWAGGLAAIALVLYVGNLALNAPMADMASVDSRERRESTQAVPESIRGDSRSQPSAQVNRSPAVVGGIVANEKSPRSEMAASLSSEQEYSYHASDSLETPGRLSHSERSDSPAPIGPMIIRTAQLALITKDFDKARESVESILKRHRGYVGELKVGGSTGVGRTLTGTLHVPADQLDATIADLKPLGRVESESQSGQDVTSQYVDLQARLANARNTEQRLTDLLRNRTGKLSDVLEVEQEVDRVRGEIEQMEAERKGMANQVSFATVSVTISEDYKAQLQVVPPSTFTRLSNAAVAGYRTVVDGVLDVTLFLLTAGPSLLLWGLVLFFPARFAWKKLRRGVAQ